ncbi:MAG: fluoride efflux transporter CrcB [Coriobacteriia bacterium]|nr:fluoride efflux transporter CrcB [Coriobacteriia bacterium]
MEALAVALGGALGSLGRWGIGGALRTVLPDLPAGTFVANVLAGLIIGATTNLGAAVDVDPNVKAFVTVGLCGGLSTFSTFSNETFTLIDTGDALGAALNIVANVGACLLAVYLGRRLGAAVA